jgi:hypothetical protein
MSRAMQNVVNRRWLLKSYPEGMPSLENWTIETHSQCPTRDRGRSLSGPNGFPSTLICAAA